MKTTKSFEHVAHLCGVFVRADSAVMLDDQYLANYEDEAQNNGEYLQPPAFHYLYRHERDDERLSSKQGNTITGYQEFKKINQLYASLGK